VPRNVLAQQREQIAGLEKAAIRMPSYFILHKKYFRAINSMGGRCGICRERGGN
jgi:hypothetical protein